jgi:2-iminobutanoate/2-iminopropanoate deaminase
MRRPKRSGRTLKASRCVDDRVTFGLDFFFFIISLLLFLERERERETSAGLVEARGKRARARGVRRESVCVVALFLLRARARKISLSLGDFFFLASLAHSLLLSLSLLNETKRNDQAGGLLYTCGCVAFVPETMEIIEGGIEAETRQALTNMGEILKAGGSDFTKVVKTTVFLTDMADFPKMNAIYSEFFSTPGPARSTVAVASLPRGALFEIDAIAEC